MARCFVLTVFVAALACVQPSTEVASPSTAVLASHPSSSPEPSPEPEVESGVIDDDGDGVVGEADQCPDMPEDIDGEADDDGCPDLACRLDPCGIALLEPVYFKTHKWELDERSHRMIEDVAWVMSVKPELTVELRGHTDSTGPDAHNLELSQRRVDSVMRYLITQGVAPERMTSRGYGEDVPVDTNRTESGRANNRRVEIVRTDTDECRA